MAPSNIWAVLPCLIQLAIADFPLAGQLFQLQGASSVNNAKLTWPTVSGASAVRLLQSII